MVAWIWDKRLILRGFAGLASKWRRWLGMRFFLGFGVNFVRRLGGLSGLKPAYVL